MNSLAIEDLRGGRSDWHPTEQMSFTLREVAEATGGLLVADPHDLVLDRLVTHSRPAGTRAPFVALTGEAMDGHRRGSGRDGECQRRSLLFLLRFPHAGSCKNPEANMEGRKADLGRCR